MIGNSQKGFAAIYITLVVLALMFGMGSSLFFTTFQEQARMQNDLRSSQAYVGAESGLEDALLRISEGMNVPSTYTFSVAGTEAEVAIAEDFGETRTITVEGDRLDRIRNVEGVYALSGMGSTFFFGAQVGEGGLSMNNNSRVLGNVYSNGSIEGDSGAEITGSAIVAGDGASGNEIEDVSILGDAMAPSFDDCTVGGDLTFVTGGEVDDCSVEGSITEQADPIPSADFPVEQSQIDEWKTDAAAGGIISAGDFSPPSGDTVSIGPGVIMGDMILKNNQTVILEGIVYVKGGVDIDNGGSVVLSPTYGSSSGILLTDTWIHVKNNGEFGGSGVEGSYLMMLALAPCTGSNGGGDCTDHNGAIDLHNNAEGAIFYAPNGLLHIHNNVTITQATAWKLELSNNTILEYSLGLQSALFTSGPSAGWEVISWKEVE
ncbi:MAG TPA: hypothetical protein ENI04_01250 [Candidatus Wildermuthbacteria bacterium]|nr:hypothetical protein [Candidatus Wildermuthbacteria bacterium]